MQYMKWFVLAALIALAGCGAGDGDFEDEDMWQKTFTPGTPLTITLDSGAGIAFPQNAFTEEVKVLFSDTLTTDDSLPENYPTASKGANDMLGGVVLNTPVDAVFNASIPVTIAMFEYTTDAPVVRSDTDYAVYRFDFEENRWNRWGDLVARTNASGTLATLAMPTTGFMGFLGTIAIFEGLTVSAIGEAQATYIEGNVRDLGNNPLETDVAVYQLIGDVKYPVDLSGLNATARVPTLVDPSKPEQNISVACVVDSDPTTGHFNIVLPWRLIGSLIRLEFGREHAGHQVQDEWVIDYPLPYEEDDWGDRVSALAVAYGRNTISPQPVLAGN